MSNIRDILDSFIAFLGGLGPWGIALLSATVLLFAVQIRFYLARYGYMTKWRRREGSGKRPPLSVITVIAGNNYEYLEETLPLILGQDYGEFEVVLVDLSGDADFSEALSQKSKADDRISVTRLAVNPQFPISNKMALNMGIKAARNEHLIFTAADSFPCSSMWLQHIAAGFDEADIVLGYGSMEVSRAPDNRRMRMSIVGHTARWTCAAMRGKPYRGTTRNMGFTKSVYFGNNGFNHLNLNTGEDDLFLQHIIRGGARTAVVLEPDSFVRRRQWGGPRWWHRERLLRSNSFRFYTARARCYIGAELWGRALFFACAAVSAIVMPVEIKITAAALLLIRFVIVAVQTARVSRRLREPGLWSALPLYDLSSPLYEAIICVVRRLRRTTGLWR